MQVGQLDLSICVTRGGVICTYSHFARPANERGSPLPIGSGALSSYNLETTDKLLNIKSNFKNCILSKVHVKLPVQEENMQ